MDTAQISLLQSPYRKDLLLDSISLCHDSCTKCFEGVLQYGPKLGFGKEAKQNDSVVYCEILGGALHAAESFLYQLLQPTIPSGVSFCFFMEAWQAE